MTENHMCEAHTRPRDRWDIFNPQQCHRAAVVECGGKWYCKIHDPEYRKAKTDERLKAWNQKWAREHQERQREHLIMVAFDGVSIVQIEERMEAGQCPCCGKPRP